MSYLVIFISLYRFFITLTVMRQSRFCANISATMGNGAFVFFSLIDDFNFLFGSLILWCLRSSILVSTLNAYCDYVNYNLIGYFVRYSNTKNDQFYFSLNKMTLSIYQHLLSSYIFLFANLKAILSPMNFLDTTFIQ